MTDLLRPRTVLPPGRGRRRLLKRVVVGGVIAAVVIATLVFILSRPNIVVARVFAAFCTQVGSGAHITVQFRLTNLGESGYATIELVQAGQVVHSQTVHVGGHSEEDFQWDIPVPQCRGTEVGVRVANQWPG